MCKVGATPAQPQPTNPEPKAFEDQKPGLFEHVTGIYDALWKAAIRPNRAQPSAWQRDACFLGVKRGEADAILYRREDFQLKNDCGHALECIHFVPQEEKRQPRPVVVYVHGMSGCRFDVLRMIPYLLKYDVTVCSLDLAGSGASEGAYVSLGHHEQRDLGVVLKHLRGLPSVTSIGLWGWSMGAVAAILRAADDKELAACVFDSPFADFRTVASELADTAIPGVPSVFKEIGLSLVSWEARSRAGFDPLELRPISVAPKASCPALFAVAVGDVVTLPHHTQELHEAWGGDKSIASFNGDHNSTRPAWFYREGARFLWERFDGDEIADVDVAACVFRLPEATNFHTQQIKQMCAGHFKQEATRQRCKKKEGLTIQTWL